MPDFSLDKKIYRIFVYEHVNYFCGRVLQSHKGQ